MRKIGLHGAPGSRRGLGQFFQDEIAIPLGAEAYIRVPDEIPNSGS
jgi:hypothetical protein